MHVLTHTDIRNLYVPPADSHKGQNGRLLVIGGSHLFHAASLWALTVASRIVDLVHYSSVPENNEIVLHAKEEFRNGIVIPRNELDAYIAEDDCILLGPGMTRDNETETLTNTLLERYAHKQWVLDAGALQMMDIRRTPRNAILTPHHGEFEILWEKYGVLHPEDAGETLLPVEKLAKIAKAFHCIVLLKGKEDLVCSGGSGLPGVSLPGECVRIEGGNAGMTKGGTGDVLAGLVAALACKNDPYVATVAGAFLNKAAGDDLARTVGTYFNATDLAQEIPKTMKRLLQS